MLPYPGGVVFFARKHKEPMTKQQADFGTRAGADAARDALLQAGVSADAVRIWNILDGDAPQSGSGDARTGAGVGAVLGGAGGLVAGAAIGGYLEGGGGLPEASGVRVVVDCAEEDARRIAGILEAAGATVRRG